jgi:hypothetical protein
MSHLTPEALARLLDEAPAAQEAAHLDTCALCRAELEQMRDDVQSLSMLPDVSPAPDAWDALERRLTDEGLIRRRGFAAFGATRALQIAAALLLFVGGTLAGRLSVDASQPMLVQQTPPPAAPATQQPAPLPPPGADASRLAADDAPRAAEVETEPPARPAPRPPRAETGAVLASNNFAAGYQATTLDEAIAVLREAEELYLSALTRYAELASNADAGDPVSRLAAMQSIVLTTQAALSQTPMDPVINGYHLTALAQRDAALRQVAAVTNDRAF